MALSTLTYQHILPSSMDMEPSSTGNAIGECPVPTRGLSSAHPVLASYVVLSNRTLSWFLNKTKVGKGYEMLDEAQQQISDSGADSIIIYSTTWLSIIGHQIQADPNPTWTLAIRIFMTSGPWTIRSESMLILQRLGTRQTMHGSSK